MNSILIVEDELSLSTLMAMNLEMEGFHTDIADNGKKAVEFYQSRHYDLIILDVMLPEIDGFSLCKRIREHDVSTPILFVSAKSEPSDRIIGLKTGGDDYLGKPFHLEEFLLRVKNLIKRKPSYQQNEKQQEGIFEINGITVNTLYFTLSTHAGVEIKSLSQKEIGLLKLFWENQGKVISREVIIEKVWGTDSYPTLRTIDNFIVNLRKIFEDNPTSPKIFQSIRGVGYKFVRN